MENLKHKIEAVLFSAGKKVNIEEIAKLANTSTSMAQQMLNELKKDYSERPSSLILTDEGNAWKIIVKDEFLPIVKKILTETELTKTIMETLAVIAFKYPLKQSDLIKIRTNKAYDHLKELEEMGYISRQKHGRTRLIKLTQKFFEYFDLPEEKLKEQFKDFESIAKAIEEKEVEVEALKEEQLKKAKEEKEKDQKIKEEIASIDKEEATPEATEKPIDNAAEEPQKEKSSEEPKKLGNLEVFKEEKSEESSEEKLDNLEVVDEPSEEEIEKERKRIKKIKEEDRKKQEEKTEKEEKEKRKEKGEATGVELDEKQEKEVDKKVEEILHPQEEPKTE